MQTNVLIKGECVLKNKNKSCPYKKLSVFYNSCLKTFGSHLVFSGKISIQARVLGRDIRASPHYSHRLKVFTSETNEKE